jgi:hypothetical protein
VSSRQDQRKNDLATLKGIIRGPGTYATPSADRTDRLMQQGLVKKVRGVLRPTLKGRIVASIRR